MVNNVSYNDSHSLTFFMESTRVKEFIALLYILYKRQNGRTTVKLCVPYDSPFLCTLTTLAQLKDMAKFAMMLSEYNTKSKKEYGRQTDLVQFRLESETDTLSVCLKREYRSRIPSFTHVERCSLSTLMTSLFQITND